MRKVGGNNPNISRLQRAEQKRDSGEVHKQKAEVAQGKADALKGEASVFSAKAERYEDISSNLAVRASGMAKEAQQLRKQAGVEMRKAVGGRGMLALKSVAGGFGRMMNKLAGQELMTTKDLQKDPEAVATADKLNGAARELEINSTRFTNLAKAWATSAADMADKAGALESRSEFHEGVAANHMTAFGKAMRSAKIDETLDKVGGLAQAAGDGIRSGISGALGWGAKVMRKGADLLDKGATGIAPPDREAAPAKTQMQLEPKQTIDGVQYFDTPGNDLAKSGASVRLRTNKEASRINVKPGKANAGEIRKRVEVGIEPQSGGDQLALTAAQLREAASSVLTGKPAAKAVALAHGMSPGKGMIASIIDQTTAQIEKAQPQIEAAKATGKGMIASLMDKLAPREAGSSKQAQTEQPVKKKRMSLREKFAAGMKLNNQIRDSVLGLAKDGSKLFSNSGRQDAMKFINDVLNPKSDAPPGPQSGPEWLAVAHGVDASAMSEGQLLDQLVDLRPKLVSGREQARDTAGVKAEIARRLGGDADELNEEHIKAAVDLRERAGLSRFTPSHEVAKQLKARGHEVSAKQVASDPAGIEF